MGWRKSLLVWAVGLFCLAGALPSVTAGTPPDKPSGGGGGGGETPPDKPSGEGGGGSSDSVFLTGAHTYTSVTNSLIGETLESTTADQNVILAQTNAYVTVSNCVLNKSGDTSSEDNSNFFALNAVVAAKTAAKVCLDHSTLNSNAGGANCLFASGEGSTIYAYDCALTSTKDSSRGLDATYEGTVIASKLTITTSGDHCASLATDRGNGYISAADSTLSTAGQGSALLYSTGVIEANGVTGTATGAQIAGIEGLSTIRIKSSHLTGSGEKASEPVANGIIIYQSNSGDSTDGTATFEASDSTLASEISGGAMFYITHSEAVITVQNTALDFDPADNYLIDAAGNDGTHGWGTAGANGAEVVFTAIDQTLVGDIAVDGISAVDLYLTNSTYSGTFVQDSTNAGDGEVKVFVSADSTWTVTESCTLTALTVADGAQLVDGDGNAVSIVGTNGTVYVAGTAEQRLTVASYTLGSVVVTNAITAFEIDRSAFESLYGLSQSSGGGGSSSAGSQTYYFKPHAPTNAVVGVSYNGTKIYPDMDHKYWLDAYWTNGVTVTIDYSANTGYFFADGSSEMNLELTITENRIDFYPPAGFESAYRAQARSGATYYPTLQAAIAAGKKKLTLNDDVTLEEPLTVTNSLTLDLNSTNVLTLGSALTNAFHFTAGATISNGTINSSLAANAEGSVLMRFTDCKATLQDLSVNGRGYESVIVHDSQAAVTEKYSTSPHSLDALTCDRLVLTGNGCLLLVDYAKATLTNDCSFTVDSALASFGGLHEAAVYCSGNGAVTIADGTYASPKALQSDGGTLVVNGGTFSGQLYSAMVAGAHTNLEVLASYQASFAFNGGTYEAAAIKFADADSRSLDEFTKAEDVAIEVPEGYEWVDNVLVGSPLVAGVASAAYADAQSATSAVEKINSDKSSCIVVPEGVEAASRAVYLSKVEAAVASGNCIVVDLTAAAAAEVQSAIDEAITNDLTTASLTSADASATAAVALTTPGLYYWLEGGTEVGSITNAGASVLSTGGGALELAKPTLDATLGRAFYRISAGVVRPD